MKMTLMMLALLVAATAVSAQESGRPAVPVVVTHGEATLKRAPDRAFVNLAVETRAQTPKEAAARNAAIMTAVQQRLRAVGLAPEAIQTRAYDLQQEFDYVNGRQVPRGYTARNTIEARVDAFERLGDVIDAAIGAGATRVDSIRFDLRDRTAVERDALKQAVADARARADAAAAGAGLSISRIVKIEEGARGGIEPPRPVQMMMRAAPSEAAPPTPVSPGEIEIRATVTLTAEVK
jgi:uncharacterized protein YggE